MRLPNVVYRGTQMLTLNTSYGVFFHINVAGELFKHGGALVARECRHAGTKLINGAGAGQAQHPPLRAPSFGGKHWGGAPDFHKYLLGDFFGDGPVAEYLHADTHDPGC